MSHVYPTAQLWGEVTMVCIPASFLGQCLPTAEESCAGVAATTFRQNLLEVDLFSNLSV